MAIFAVGNRKGGVGKTTAEVNLSLALLSSERTPPGIHIFDEGRSRDNKYMLDLNPDGQLSIKLMADIDPEYIVHQNGDVIVSPNIQDFQKKCDEIERDFEGQVRQLEVEHKKEYGALRGQKKERRKLKEKLKEDTKKLEEKKDVKLKGISIEDYAVPFKKSISDKLKLIAAGDVLSLYSKLADNKYFLQSLRQTGKTNDIVVDTPPAPRSLYEVSLKALGIADHVLLITCVEDGAQHDAYRFGTTLLAYNLLSSVRENKSDLERIRHVEEVAELGPIDDKNYSDIEMKALELDKRWRTSDAEDLPELLVKAKKYSEDINWYHKKIKEAKARTKIQIVFNKIKKGKSYRYVDEEKGIKEWLPQEKAAELYFMRLAESLGEKGVAAERLARLPFSEELEQNSLIKSLKVMDYHRTFNYHDGNFKGTFGMGKREPNTLEECFYKMAMVLKGR